MTDRLSELAKALADASDRLNGVNHRDDQRLMEEVATRIQARVDDYDAAYAALEAYGLEKASEGAVKVEIEAEPALENIYPQAVAASGWQVAEPGVGFGVMGQALQTASPEPYSNGLDGHNEE